MCVLHAESGSVVLLIARNIRLQYSWESKSEEVLNWNPELHLIVAVDWTCTYDCIEPIHGSLSLSLSLGMKSGPCDLLVHCDLHGSRIVADF
jgi:hypothetical protein